MAEKNKVVLEWNRWCTSSMGNRSFRLVAIPRRDSKFPPRKFMVEELTEDLIGGTRWVSVNYDEESIIHELVSAIEGDTHE